MDQGSSTVVYKVSYAQFNPSIIYERSSEVYERVCEFYVGVRCICDVGVKCVYDVGVRCICDLGVSPFSGLSQAYG
mgnify:CR=1 FL=1